MINVPRRLLRQLRIVFRHALRTSPRASIPAVVFRATPHGLTARAQTEEAAIEYHLPGKYSADEASVPGDLLVDCEHRSDDPVTIENQKDGQILASWRDGKTPLLMRYQTPEQSNVGEFPDCPERMAENVSPLISALRDASQTADPTTVRYALDYLELRGEAGSICATDGKQLLVQGGFTFPWEENVLLPRSTLFGCKELRPLTPVSIGKRDSWLTISMGPWRYYTKLGEDLRFPNTDDHLRSADSAGTRLNLTPTDAQFLAQSLPELPCIDEEYQPITLDMNGQIMLRVKGESQPTELVLTQSSRIGEPLCINTDRRYLARALRLGFREFTFFGPNVPTQCSDGSRQYVWAVLDPQSAIKPTSKAVRLASPTGDVETVKSATDHPQRKTEMKEATTDDKKPSGAAESPRRKKAAFSPVSTNGDLSSMIAEARTALREADGKLRALSAALAAS